MTRTHARTPDEQIRHRARYLSGLVYHVGTFLIISAFFWTMDAGLGQDGIQWAHWVSGFWAIALAFHGLAYYVDGRGIEDRMIQRHERELQDH